MRPDYDPGMLQTNKDIEDLSMGRSVKIRSSGISMEKRTKRQRLAKDYLFMKNRRDTITSINDMFGEEIVNIEEEFHKALSVLQSPRSDNSNSKTSAPTLNLVKVLST